MKQFLNKCFLLLAIAGVFAACSTTDMSESVDEITQKEANSMLQVRTRATSAEGEATVSYPVYVYVFKGNDCVALQTIHDGNETLSIPLVEGTYSVYAVGGASSTDYTLPSQESATSSVTVVLKDGKSHGDLMVAKSTVVLTEGGTNMLTLAMERKVMMLQSVSLQKIPFSATAVSLTFSPLWTSMAGTTYAGESGTETIDLTQQEDGHTWTFTGSKYLLPPSSNPATISVNVTTSTGTSSYTYSIAESLEAGDIINVQGKYTEAMGVTLTGTIEGAVWKDEKTISFEFNESGSSTAGEESGDDTGDVTPTTTIPAVGDTYQGCYVLSVSENNGVADVLILSPNQKKMDFTNGESSDQAMIKVEAAMSECAVTGIDGWRLMTREEAKVFHTLNIDQTAAAAMKVKWGDRFLFEQDGVLKAIKLGSGDFSPSGTLKPDDILRPVTIVKLTTE